MSTITNDGMSAPSPSPSPSPAAAASAPPSSAVVSVYTCIAVLQILVHIPCLFVFWRNRNKPLIHVRKPLIVVIISSAALCSAVSQCAGNIAPQRLSYFFFNRVVSMFTSIAIDALTLFAISLLVAFNMTRKRKRFFTNQQQELSDRDLRYNIRLAKSLFSPIVVVLILCP